MLAQYLIDLGYRLLISDWDDQANLTYTLSERNDYTRQPLSDFLRSGKAQSEDGKNHLLSATNDLLEVGGKGLKIGEKFARISKDFDYHILDMPPGAGERLFVGLALADKIVVPLTTSDYSLASSLRFFEMLSEIDAQSKFAGFVLNDLRPADKGGHDIIDALNGKVIATLKHHKHIELSVTESMGGKIMNSGKTGQARKTIYEVSESMHALAAKLGISSSQRSQK